MFHGVVKLFGSEKTPPGTLYKLIGLWIILIHLRLKFCVLLLGYEQSDPSDTSLIRPCDL